MFVIVLWLFLMVPWVGTKCVIVVFADLNQGDRQNDFKTIKDTK